MRYVFARTESSINRQLLKASHALNCDREAQGKRATPKKQRESACATATILAFPGGASFRK
jgi:hypothetical protein